MSETGLTLQLRALERDDAVALQAAAPAPRTAPRVEYALTPYGETLRAALEAACA